MKNILFLAVFLFPILLFGQFGESIRTGRPGQAIGAFSLGQRVFQLQTGYTYNNIEDEENQLKSSIQSSVLRLGITERFEFSGVINWQSDKVINDAFQGYLGGISNTQIGGRLNLSKNKGWLPTICIQGRLLLKAQSEPYQRAKLGSRFVLATGNKISDKLSVGTNWGITWKGNGQDPTASYVLNLSYSLNDKLGMFTEIYGQLNDFNSSFDTGLSYLINNNFQLDVSTGWQGQNATSNWFIDFGFSWRMVWRE